MKILVLGASGKVGRLVVEDALNRGHKVHALVHSDSLNDQPNLKVYKGDIYDPDSINKALAGVDVVISCLGSWGTKHKNVVSTGIENIVPLAKKHKINRIVTLTGHGARAPAEKLDLVASISRNILKIAASKILYDGEKSLEELHRTKLDWVGLRSPIMVNFFEPSRFEFSSKRPWPLSIINRKSVAIALLDLAEANKIDNKVPFIKRG